jgi:hypothetical protein
MTQTRGGPDFSSPDPGSSGRTVPALIRLIKFAVAGAVVGAIVGHMIGGTVYLSRGDLRVDAPTSESNSNLTAPRQPLTLSIITTALSAARNDPSGASLPSSPSSALDHATIEFGQTNDVVEISYRGSDPEAAGCMARAIIKAYTDALAAGISGPAPSVKEIAVPVAGRPIRDFGSAVTYGLVGGGVGIAVCAALAALRKATP